VLVLLPNPHRVCQDGNVTRSLRHVVHVVSSATHKSRTVHEIRDTKCHERALNNFVMTSRDNLELEINKFLSIFQNFRHHMHYSSDPHRHASRRTLSRILHSLARQIATCRGVNRLSCQCEPCFSSSSRLTQQCDLRGPEHPPTHSASQHGTTDG